MKIKTAAKHTPDLPLPIKKKLSEIESGYFLNMPPAQVDVNAPRALMQTSGEGWTQGIRWVMSQPLYAAAPDLLEAVKLLQAALTEYGLRDVKKRYSLCVADAAASSAVAKAEGK